jgi:hypothetical protein
MHDDMEFTYRSCTLKMTDFLQHCRVTGESPVEFLCLSRIEIRVIVLRAEPLRFETGTNGHDPPTYHDVALRVRAGLTVHQPSARLGDAFSEWSTGRMLMHQQPSR